MKYRFEFACFTHNKGSYFHKTSLIIHERARIFYNPLQRMSADLHHAPNYGA